MSIVGSLKVLLGLDATDFTTGLTKADAAATKFAAKQKQNQAAIDKSIVALQKQADQYGKTAGQIKLMELAQRGATDSQLKAADAALKSIESQKAIASAGRLLGAAAVAAAGGILLMVKNSIDAADHLNDLSKKTGVAVDTLGGIGFAARQAGSDLDSASAAVGKLNKSIAAATAGNTEAFEPFKALGISIKELESQSPDQILTKIADKFQTFEDGPNKAALALKLFGKAGADLIPLLDEGGRALTENIEFFKRYSGVTSDVAARSDAFNDTIEKVKLLTASLGTSLASALLPALQALADAFLRTKQEGDGFAATGKVIAGVFELLVNGAATVNFGFQVVGKTIGGYIAQLAALARLDFKGTTAISEAYGEDIARAKRDLKAFTDSVSGTTAGVNDRARARLLRESGNAGVVKIRAPSLPDSGAASAANAELKKRLDGQLKAIRDFAQQQRDGFEFANRFVQGAYSQGLTSLSAFFDAQKALRAASLSATIEGLDKEIQAQRDASKRFSGADRIKSETDIAEAVAKRAQAVIKADQDEKLADQERAIAIKQVQDRYDELRATIKALKGDTAGAATIRINQQVDEARTTAIQAGQDPEAAARALRIGLEGQLALSEATKDYNKLLEQSRNAEESILLTAQTTGLGEIATLRAVGAARAQSLDQLKNMAIQARELADTLNTDEARAFADQLALAFQRAAAEVDPLADKIKGIGTEISQAFDFTDAITGAKSFKDVLNDIDKQIAAIIIREAITKPIQEGTGGILKGSGSGGGVGDLFGSFFKSIFGGFRANGGPTQGGSAYVVGERGPELFIPRGSGTIVPNGGGRSVILQYHAAPGESRETSNQRMADGARLLGRASARFS